MSIFSIRENDIEKTESRIAGEVEGERGEGEFVARIVLWESVRCE